jgi:hypothetical protein
MENPDIGRETLCSQMEKLIVGPFQATQTQTLIVIDALDECRDEEPASALLSVLSRYVDKIPLVKFFITGRPEPRIRSGFRLESLRPHTDVLRLHEVEPSSVDSDIKLFLKLGLLKLPRTEVTATLQRIGLAHTLMFSARKQLGFSSMLQQLSSLLHPVIHPPDERLALIVSLPQDTSHEGKSGIDLLYTQVLEQAFHDVDSHDHELYSRFKSVVGAVVLIFHPLSINTLSDLLRNCGTPSRISSLYANPPLSPPCPRQHRRSSPDLPQIIPRLPHRSRRCTDHRFFIDPSIHHKEILLSCLNVMKDRLKRNICNLDDHAVLSEVEGSSHTQDHLHWGCPGICMPVLDKPSCKDSWQWHGVEEVHKAIDKFFKTGFLFWIEVLILTGNLDIGVYALNDIEQWYMLVSHIQSFHQNLCSFLFRQEFPASGQVIASVLSWKILTQSRTLLLRCTILLSHFALPHPGSMSTILQSSHKSQGSGGTS